MFSDGRRRVFPSSRACAAPPAQPPPFPSPPRRRPPPAASGRTPPTNGIRTSRRLIAGQNGRALPSKTGFVFSPPLSALHRAKIGHIRFPERAIFTESAQLPPPLPIRTGTKKPAHEAPAFRPRRKLTCGHPASTPPDRFSYRASTEAAHRHSGRPCGRNSSNNRSCGRSAPGRRP